MLSSYVAQYVEGQISRSARPDVGRRVEFGHEFNTAEASGLVGAIPTFFFSSGFVPALHQVLHPARLPRVTIAVQSAIIRRVIK